MPAQYERGNTTMSLASQDLLQQKKLNLHEGVNFTYLSNISHTLFVFANEMQLSENKKTFFLFAK